MRASDRREAGIPALFAFFFIIPPRHPGFFFAANTYRELQGQGTSKERVPGCVNMVWKICVFLPAEGEQNATWSPSFTKPGKGILEVPCRGEEQRYDHHHHRRRRLCNRTSLFYVKSSNPLSEWPILIWRPQTFWISFNPPPRICSHISLSCRESLKGYYQVMWSWVKKNPFSLPTTPQTVNRITGYRIDVLADLDIG